MTTAKSSLKSTSQRLACLQAHFFILAFAKILCFSNKEHFIASATSAWLFLDHFVYFNACLHT
jgi:hypothetical protein